MLTVAPEPGWYTYTNNPESLLGKPTTLAGKIEPGGRAIAALYPKGKKKDDPIMEGETINVYPGRFNIYVPVPDFSGNKLAITGELSMLFCTPEKCTPVNVEEVFALDDIRVSSLPLARDQEFWPEYESAAPGKAQEVRAPAASPAPVAAPGQDLWSGIEPRYFSPGLEVGGLFTALLFGLIAGFILNFMPCVLPVVALKLSTLVVHDGDKKLPRDKIFREHNIFFALGVMVYFLVLSIALALTGAAWGQVFQQPTAVMVMVTVVFGLSLSLFGLYHLPIVDLKKSSGAESNPKLQAFFTGLLATLLATPCSGPFLGGVLGWALVQPPVVLSSVFMFIGLGMAAPYLIMAVWPKMVRIFPKPGPWIGHLEKVVAFFLMATVVYLMSILPQSRLVDCLIILWFTALAAWVWGMTGPGCSRLNACAVKGLALAVLAAGLVLGLPESRADARWTEFDTGVMDKYLGQKPLFVEFTADWCPTCKVLERTVLTGKNLSKWQEKYGFVPVKVDLTEPDAPAEALLKKLGSRSIPVAAIFPSGPDARRPLVIRDLYTADQLRQAFENTLNLNTE